MQLLDILRDLAKAGSAQDYPNVEVTTALQPHMCVVQFLDHERNSLISTAAQFTQLELISIIKAIAVLEHLVGGRGSVTHLKRLLDLVQDPDRELLDWILRNTKSYWYYSHDAKSVKEYDLICQEIASRTAKRISADDERKSQDKIRVAVANTDKLFNAVRRGDFKAVEALILGGANPQTLTPNGESLINFAETRANAQVIAILKAALAAKSAP